MEIIIDKQNVALIDANNKLGFIEEIISREEFETNFHLNLGSITNVTYAPLKHQYFVTYGELDVQVFQEPSKNEVLNHIDINKDAIVSHIINVWVENHKPSKYHTIGSDGLFTISDSDQILLNNDNKVEEAKRYLKSTDYKVLPDYDGDTTGIVEARATARATIRSLEII